MTTMNDIVRDFDPISLEEMDGIRLMNRTDTKFVTTAGTARRLLAMAAADYRVQETGGERVMPYYTLYFDTPDMSMFTAHHNGHANRQKLRIRSYVDSGLNFLEVKTKNNHGRTRKKRTAIEGFDPLHPQHGISFGSDGTQDFCRYAGFVRQHLNYRPEAVHEQIENRFCRTTLVNRQKTERLTIDSCLCFHNLSTGRSVSLDNIVIIELKRDGQAVSPILPLLRELRIKPMGFSKYCIGSALTNAGLRTNRFKMRLHTIEKMNNNGLHI